MEHDTMLAIVGSPGSGKTTVSIKMALEIAQNRKNVIVVFCDPFVPPIPFVLSADTEHDTSLGALLTVPALTQKMILDSCVPVKTSEYISLLGYKAGENLMTYPKVTRDKAVEFMVCLRHLADYVILDCTTVFEADAFSLMAMEVADMVFRIGTSNLRGITYFQSHAGLLSNRIGQSEKQLSAIGNFRVGQEWEAVSEQYGGASYVFPYVEELEKQYDEAALLEQLTSREAAAFNCEIKKVLSDVLGIEPVKKDSLPTIKHQTVSREKRKGFKFSFSRSGEF